MSGKTQIDGSRERPATWGASGRCGESAVAAVSSIPPLPTMAGIEPPAGIPPFYLFFGSAEQTAPSRAGYPGKQKGMDLEMMLSDIINDLKPEEAAKMRLLCQQFKRCRAALVEEKKENEALKAQIAELRRQLDETEQTNQAGDKAFVQLVNRNHTTTRRGVYRFG